MTLSKHFNLFISAANKISADKTGNIRLQHHNIVVLYTYKIMQKVLNMYIFEEERVLVYIIYIYIYIYTVGL